MRTPFKMKGFSGFGNSPMKQDKKKKYKKATEKQLKPYTDLDLSFDNEPFLPDTLHPKTKETFTRQFVNYVGSPKDKGVKALIGNYDLKMKGRRDITE